MLAMIAIQTVQARILGDGVIRRTSSDARTGIAVEEAGSFYPLTVPHPNHWWEPMRCYPSINDEMFQEHNPSWYATQQVRCYSEQLFTATESVHSGWVASFVTDLFSGWGGEFCDRPFFRDGVASFVTDPFFGMGSRVL